MEFYFYGSWDLFANIPLFFSSGVGPDGVVTPPTTPSSILNNTAPAPGVRLRITTGSGEDISGTRLGEKLFLRIEIDKASIYGIFAKNLRAISPADEDSIELLDSRGCPTDRIIFPGLEKVPGSEDLQVKFEKLIYFLALDLKYN